MAEIYLDKPEQWKALAAKLMTIGEFATDTETYGQPDKTSPQHRAIIHCFSVGVLTAKHSGRGYRIATGRVLPVAALECSELRDVFENPSIKRWAHNAPHDEHAFRNHGLSTPIDDTLQYLRVSCPGAIGGYGLKDAEGWALGLPPRPSFQDMVTYETTETRITSKRHQACICGKNPCRARSTSDFLGPDGLWHLHTRVSWRTFTPHPKEVEAKYLVQDFGPEHPRWSQWVDYSLADSTGDMMLVDWLRTRPHPKPYYPWTQYELPNNN